MRKRTAAMAALAWLLALAALLVCACSSAVPGPERGGAAEPGELAYSISAPRLQDPFHVLNGTGPVALEMPARTIDFALSGNGSAPWYAVTTWTERETSDFYCVEPWLGLPNAIHHGHGLRWVPAGAAEHATCRITVR